MADKRFLHELLEEDQEPFHLKRYIAGKRSQLKSPPLAATAALQIRKRKPVAEETASKFSNFCFYSFQRSPDVGNPPFIDFQSASPMSPCKSPVFLRVPPRTAALLVEAAMRIQNQQQSKRRTQVGILGFGIFGTFVKRLKDRSRKNKKLAIGGEILGNREAESKEEARISRSSDEIRLNNRFDLGNFTSDQSEEMNNHYSFALSPFRFSLHRSSSSAAGSHTPEVHSPNDSPNRVLQQEQANPPTRNSNNIQDDKEHCSPVSVLDSFFDDEHEIGEPESDADHGSNSYANIQRVKKQLLSRLRRFEKLAELDPIELESNFDDDECQSIDEACSPCREKGTELELFNLSSLQHNSSNAKRVFLGKKEVWGRICKKFSSSEEVGFIDMLAFEDDWEKFSEEVKEAAKEVELAIIGVLVEELLEI